MAKLCNLEYLGKTSPPNTKTPARWRCLAGNGEIEKSYNWLYTKNYCPLCGQSSGKVKRGKPALKPAAYHKLAKAAGLRWLGEGETPGANTPTDWECIEKQHPKLTTYTNVKRNKLGCFQCRTGEVEPEEEPEPVKERPLMREWFLEKSGEPWYSPVKFGPKQ